GTRSAWLRSRPRTAKAGGRTAASVAAAEREERLAQKDPRSGTRGVGSRGAHSDGRLPVDASAPFALDLVGEGDRSSEPAARPERERPRLERVGQPRTVVLDHRRETAPRHRCANEHAIARFEAVADELSDVRPEIAGRFVAGPQTVLSAERVP